MEGMGQSEKAQHPKPALGPPSPGICESFHTGVLGFSFPIWVGLAHGNSRDVLILVGG